MNEFSHFFGVYAAAVTPLQANFLPDLAEIPHLLEFLADRGCHGALILGTTGEGPSFSPNERSAIFAAAADFRRTRPGFRLLAGTGTPSMQETIEINRYAFEVGMDGVVTLPPYYFRSVSDEGLFAWYSKVIEQSVAPGKALFGYHFPKVSGVSLSLDLLERLLTAFPDQFAGIKDSSGDPEFALQLGVRFGTNLHVMTGNDRLFTHALTHSAAGCITAMANLYSPFLRKIWDAHQANRVDTSAQQALDERRTILDRYPPAPALIKAMLSDQHGFPGWPVRPALMALDTTSRSEALALFASLDA
jgi:4-hydroxy-tetrahydrodipicolinate synthase